MRDLAQLAISYPLWLTSRPQWQAGEAVTNKSHGGNHGGNPPGEVLAGHVLEAGIDAQRTPFVIKCPVRGIGHRLIIRRVLHEYRRRLRIAAKSIFAHALAPVGALFMLGRVAHGLGMDGTSLAAGRSAGTIITMLTQLGLAIAAVLVVLGKL